MYFNDISAQELIELLDLYPPINLYKICDYFNIKVVTDNLQDAYAYFCMQKGKKIIILNTSIIGTEKERFTLAHELGHYFLPEHLWNEIDVYKEDNYNIYKSKKRIETDVDKFAAELLMPSNYIDSELSNISLKDFKELTQIAKKYDVSLTSLLFKYINLNSDTMALLYYENGKQKWQYKVYGDFFYNIYEGDIINDTSNQYIKDTLNNWLDENFSGDVYQVVFNLEKYNSKLVLLEIKDY